MGTVSNKTKKVAHYGTIRDLLLADIALKQGLLTSASLTKGVAVLTEMDACGISSGLFNVLAARKLFDRSQLRDLVQPLGTVQMRCPRCRRSTSLSGLTSKDCFKCSSCESQLELNWGGPEINLSEGDPQDLAQFLEATVLKAGDGTEEEPVGGAKVQKMGAFESAASMSSPSPVAKAEPPPAPAAAKPAPTKRARTSATHYPEPPAPVAKDEEPKDAPRKKPVGKTKVEKVDARKLVTNYRVGKVINSGPYGRTYAATSSEGAAMVVKVLAPDRAPNAKNHEQLASALSQWAVVDPERPSPSHTLEVKDGAAFVVRSFIDEPFKSLANLQLGDGSHRFRVLQVIARDLARIHSSGHIHGNLKPSNIFVRLSNTSGEAHFVDPALHMVVPEDNDMERWKILVNAPRFRSPEEIRGEPLSSASDIYSLGWVFYTVLTGKWPFAGEARPEILRRHIEGPCPELGKDASTFHALIESMTALDAGERPQSAADIVGLLQQVSGKKTLKLPTVTPRPSQNELPTESEETARSGGGVLKYALGPIFLAVVLGLVGWCGYKWFEISRAVASPDRDQDVYHQVAEEVFYETREASRAAPHEGSERWEEYRASFGDTPLDGAAAAEQRNFESTSD